MKSRRLIDILGKEPDMSKRETPGQRLRRLREAAGLSQARLAELAGVTDATVGHLETGERDLSRLGLGAALALARALGTTAEELAAK